MIYLFHKKESKKLQTGGTAILVNINLFLDFLVAGGI
jgi:hypothetical protein